MDLHEIARQVATTSGADFAFVLSQAGLLVTHDAPRDMPDRGRMKILWACPSGKNDVTHLEMSREELVPYGGAAPIDVFAIRVEDTAILVAVMASWNDKGSVMLALTSGAAALGEMIRSAKRARAQKVAGRKPAEPAKRERTGVPFSDLQPRERTAVAFTETPRRERTAVLPGESTKRERTSTLPAEGAKRERASVLPAEGAKRERASVLPAEGTKRERASVLPAEGGRRDRASAVPPERRSRPSAVPPARKPSKSDAKLDATAKRRNSEPKLRASSEPEITVGEASVGRETLYAIETALQGPAGPTPEGVRIELVSIGRETMAEIALADAAENARSPTVEEPLVVPSRRTLPWIDAGAVKRAVEAKAKARGAAPPDLKITVEELDPEALERALREDDER